jgi:hypothetical protein
MNTAPILAWVNCYGAWDPQLRQPLETIGYNEYLNGVAEAIFALRERIRVVYVSGGMYDERGLTECETTIPELKRRLETKGMSVPEIMADEESVTSITIVKTFLRVWQEQYADHQAVLFCDAIRYHTDAYVLEHFAAKFGYDLPLVREILVPFPRLDPHPHCAPEKQAEKLEKMKKDGVEEVERAGMEARKEHLKKG